MKKSVMNYVPGPGSFERKTPGLKNNVQPNEALSVRQLYDKFRKSGGVTPSGVRVREMNDQGIPDDADPEDELDLEKAQASEPYERAEIAAAAKEALLQKQAKVDAIEKVAAKKRADKQKEYDDVVAHMKAQKAKPENKDPGTGSL